MVPTPWWKLYFISFEEDITKQAFSSNHKDRHLRALHRVLLCREPSSSYRQLPVSTEQPVASVGSITIAEDSLQIRLWDWISPRGFPHTSSLYLPLTKTVNLNYLETYLNFSGLGAGVSVGPSGTQVLLLVVFYLPEMDLIYMQVNQSPCPSENCKYQKVIEPSNGRATNTPQCWEP